MDTPRKLLVGYDLCEDYTQISCYSYKTMEPVTISIHEKEEYSLIPTVLCMEEDTGNWLYGKEGKDCAALGKGILLTDFLKKIKTGEEIETGGQKYTGMMLLGKFLRKTLMLVKNYFPTELITRLVVTVKDTDTVIMDGIYEALSMLGIERDRAVVISHDSAYLYYALSQKKMLWMNDVGLFDFDEAGLTYYQISINRRVYPIVAGVTKKSLTDTLSYDMIKDKSADLGYALENAANTVLYKQIISTLYFTGKGFEGVWIEEAVKHLCKGRRAFLGHNLYTKGACYAAMELSGNEKLGDFILLSEEKIINSVSVCVYKDGKMEEVILAQAGLPWYDVNRSIEVIPQGLAEIEIILRNSITRETVKEKLVPNDFDCSQDRMVRLEINLVCTSKSFAKVTITDVGFGEICPGTGHIWEFTIEI
jgi:hypothetical protein